MTNKPPAFQFYAKDWLSDPNVSEMTMTERGIYHHLLCHSWLEGSIPSDMEKLAKRCGMPLAEFEQCWEAIKPCWSQAKAELGRLVNPRLEGIREAQRIYREKMVKAGRKGGRSRSTKKPSGDSQEVSQAQAKLKPGHPSASSSSTVPENRFHPSFLGTSVPVQGPSGMNGSKEGGSQ